MTELDPMAVLAILTGIAVFLKTRSVLYGTLGLVFAPFLWYAGASVVIVGSVLVSPFVYLAWWMDG